MTEVKNFKEYISYYISIDDYFHMFYNFKKGTFLNMTHGNMKRMFPFIETISSDRVTREDILRGSVLLVRDESHNIMAYSNPFVLEDINSCMDKILENDQVSCESTLPQEEDFDESTICDMNRYELASFKKKLLSNHDYKTARAVSKELYFKSRQEHGTKKSKIRKLLKKENREEWLYDKY